MMNLGDAITVVYSKYFDFTGRASRAEYWWWYLFNFLITLIPIVGIIAIFVNLIPSLAVTVRRYHDSNHSGFHLLGQFLLLFLTVVLTIVFAGVGTLSAVFEDFTSAGLSVIGIISIWFISGTICLVWWLVLCLRPSTPGDNRYGPNPYGHGSSSSPRQGGARDVSNPSSSKRGNHWTLSGFDSLGNVVRLEFSTQGHSGRVFVIGRNPTDCDLVISDQGVSRRHAEISIIDNNVFIQDLGSSNGTRLNGQRLSKDRKVSLPPQGTLALGSVELAIVAS